MHRFFATAAAFISKHPRLPSFSPVRSTQHPHHGPATALGLRSLSHETSVIGDGEPQLENVVALLRPSYGSGLHQPPVNQGDHSTTPCFNGSLAALSTAADDYSDEQAEEISADTKSISEELLDAARTLDVDPLDPETTTTVTEKTAGSLLTKEDGVWSFDFEREDADTMGHNDRMRAAEFGSVTKCFDTASASEGVAEGLHVNDRINGMGINHTPAADEDGDLWVEAADEAAGILSREENGASRSDSETDMTDTASTWIEAAECLDSISADEGFMHGLIEPGDALEGDEMEEDEEFVDPRHVLTLEEVKEVLQNVRARDVCILPVEDRCEWTNFMVFATGISDRHVRGIADALIYKIKKKSYIDPTRYPTVEGGEKGKWLLVDCGSIVIHALSEEARTFYNLEEFWSGKQKCGNADQDLQKMLKIAGLKPAAPRLHS